MIKETSEQQLVEDPLAGYTDEPFSRHITVNDKARLKNIKKMILE